MRTNTIIPSQTLLVDLGLIVGGAAVTAVTAQVTIASQPVPVTLQTLGVMVCGLSLGAKRGALSQLAYLAAGVAGAPIFANHTFGLQELLGKTGGYLWGFVLMALLLGWAADRGFDKKVVPCAGFVLAAIAVQLFCGWAWLSGFIGAKAAFLGGVAPFILLELVKGAVATASLPTLRAFLPKSPAV
jgi:biotin transport system substrate-specific component